MRREGEERFVEDLCKKAGEVIRRYYLQGGYAQSTKEDASPLTSADLASHTVIVGALRERYPHIPVVSEESATVPYDVRREWRSFWLVDPLDGTKEFIHRQDEFTVNVALVEEGVPTFGVVYVPVYDVMYGGKKGVGCWKVRGDSRREMVPSASQRPEERIKVGVSRFHLDALTKAFLDTFRDQCVPVVCGSSLKFCYVADGSLDLYLRFGPTWEWDSAAGHAVVEAAGGVVMDMRGEPIRYNKTSLKNVAFVVTKDREWLVASDYWRWLREQVARAPLR